MSRVITFSRKFPSYHPEKGNETYFVEQLYNSLYEKSGDWSDAIDPDGKNTSYVIPLNHSIADKKHHTIRAGRRWKVGDKFSPRVWSGKPYKSKQIIIAPDIEIKKVWDFNLLGGNCFTSWKDYLQDKDLKEIAKNDGLSLIDFMEWFADFSKNFEGQIICWNENINY